MDFDQDWGVQQKKANRSSEKNKKKLSAAVVESRLTNDISPESTPGAGRRRARTPHSFPHVKYSTQMSVPDQAELDKLHQRINFTDLDEVNIDADDVDVEVFHPFNSSVQCKMTIGAVCISFSEEHWK